MTVIERENIADTRGYFERLFCVKELQSWAKRPVEQINRTKSIKSGTLRGFHFQAPPMAEAKYITCIKGSVYDVALDLRSGSPTFGKSFGIVLSEGLSNALIIPEGVAHGFQTTSENVEMLYFHSELYSPEHEGGIYSLDKDINIDWPLEVTEMSERDKKLPLLVNVEGIYS